MPPRRFDWDEAKALYAIGLSMAEIARRHGVSETGIRRIVVPGLREKVNEVSAEWQRGGKCPQCGAVTTRRPEGKEHLCVRCSLIKRSTSAREGELQCGICREWKPDDQFARDSRSKVGRRGRHRECRACNTIRKREAGR